MDISLEIGPDVILSYRRLAYTPWHALAEFVDNSTQSYANNKDALDEQYEKEGEKLEVRIVYERDKGTIRVSDNAMGMSFDELVHAVRIGKPPAVTSGRSQFGLGMKTAACWFGDRWTVITKRLGERLEHEITVDTDEIAKNNLSLPHEMRDKDSDLHYTIIEISGLHTKLQGRRLGKIKQFLRSMYRVDIREGTLDLYWENTLLDWKDETAFLKRHDGSPYRKDFDFVVDGKKVTGWVGILERGSRSRAGFSILRRGRMVRGHPDSWRPEQIFGQVQGSNDLINQRILGEIHLDDFQVSHTKDDIQWTGDQEDEVQSKLKDECATYLKVAREYRHETEDDRGPREAEVQAAVDELRSEMESPEFADRVTLESVPPPSVVEAVKRPVLKAAERMEPNFTAVVGDDTCKVYLSHDPSPNDPYFASDIAEHDVLVVVNTRHPHWLQLKGSEGVLNYLRHCVYDAIAEWQCTRKHAPVQPDTIKLLKDALLRLPSEIEHSADAVGLADDEDQEEDEV